MPLLGNKVHFINAIVNTDCYIDTFVQTTADRDETKILSQQTKDGKSDMLIVSITGESCESEDEVTMKVANYCDRIWTCRCTGKSQMSFKEAMRSEQSTSKSLKRSIPSYFERCILESVHQVDEPLEAVIHNVWTLLHQEFCVNEPVNIKVSQPGKTNIVAVVIKVDKSAVKVAETQVAKESEMEDNSQKKKFSIPQKKKYQYTVKLLSQNKVVSGIPASAIEREVRPPNKETLRMFIRSCALRYGPSFTGPWIVNEDIVAKHQISSNSEVLVDGVALKQASREHEVDFYLRGQKKKRKLEAALKCARRSKTVSSISVISGDGLEQQEVVTGETSYPAQVNGRQSGQDSLLQKATTSNITTTTPPSVQLALTTGSPRARGRPRLSPGKPHTPGSGSSLTLGSVGGLRGPSMAQRLIKAVREERHTLVGKLLVRCAEVYTEQQLVHWLPTELRGKVLARKEGLDQKRKLTSRGCLPSPPVSEAMSPREREAHERQRRSEILARMKEQRVERNRRTEDSELTADAAPLPPPNRLPLPPGVAVDQWARLLSLTEMMRALAGLVMPSSCGDDGGTGEEMLAEGAERFTVEGLLEELVWRGRRGTGLLNQAVTLLLQTMLQDEEIMNREELDLSLSDIPFNQWSLSEMLRLMLAPPSSLTTATPASQDPLPFPPEDEPGVVVSMATTTVGATRTVVTADPYLNEDAERIAQLRERLRVRPFLNKYFPNI